MQKLIADLRHLGLSRGDVVVVHSSLSALGHVEGGAETVIKALMEVLTDEGTLLFPELTCNDVNEKNPCFDVRTSVGCVGLIPETFRKMPGTVRSLHPTHSVSAWGKYAKEMTCDHQLDNTPVGPHSPYQKLLQYNGKILMLGCSVRSMTFMHGVEEIVNAPYALRKETFRYYVTDYNGEQFATDNYRHNFGPQGLLQRYDRLLDVMSPEDYTVGKVLDGTAYLFDAATMLKVGSETIAADPYYFVQKLPIDNNSF